MTKTKHDIHYLASTTAACITSSIACPASACSAGMGTAISTPLWRPRDRVLAKYYNNYIYFMNYLLHKSPQDIKVVYQ